LTSWISQVLSQKHFDISYESRPPSNKLIITDISFCACDDIKTEEKIENSKPKNENRYDDELKDNYLFVAILTVVHFLKFILHIDHVVGLKSTPISSSELPLYIKQKERV